jgi:hypothetical protein
MLRNFPGGSDPVMLSFILLFPSQDWHEQSGDVGIAAIGEQA